MDPVDGQVWRGSDGPAPCRRGLSWTDVVWSSPQTCW